MSLIVCSFSRLLLGKSKVAYVQSERPPTSACAGRSVPHWPFRLHLQLCGVFKGVLPDESGDGAEPGGRGRNGSKMVLLEWLSQGIRFDLF